jgi:hypothetical protein
MRSVNLFEAGIEYDERLVDSVDHAIGVTKSVRVLFVSVGKIADRRIRTLSPFRPRQLMHLVAGLRDVEMKVLEKFPDSMLKVVNHVAERHLLDRDIRLGHGNLRWREASPLNDDHRLPA